MKRSRFKQERIIGILREQEAVARHPEAFRHRLPRVRKSWECADAREGLIAVVTVVLTHQRVSR